MEDKYNFVVMVSVMTLCEEHFVSKGSHLEVYTGYHIKIIYENTKK